MIPALLSGGGAFCGRPSGPVWTQMSDLSSDRTSDMISSRFLWLNCRNLMNRVCSVPEGG